MPAAKTPREWLAGQIGFLSKWGDEASAIEPLVTHEYSAHTGLKLAALNHAIGVFSPIAAGAVSRGLYDRMVYLDLFAGCGLNTLRATGDRLAGSPVIAAHAKSAFDHIVCIERRKDYCRVLRRRLELSGAKSYEVLEGDCNSIAPAWSQGESTRSIVFVNVDPEGMETRWSTIQALSERFSAADFFVNFTFGAEREHAAAKSTGRPSPVLEDLTGLDLEDIVLGPNREVSDIYQERIRSVLGRVVGDSTLIRTEGNQPLYRVLVYGRRTRGGSPWGKAYGAIHERLSALAPVDVRGALNTIKGRGIESW